MARLPREFYLGNTVEIAQNLLGKFLVRSYQGQALACRITETEAYVGRCDKACHAYNYHKTTRNATMFGPPGHAYIYLIYGMHHCLNFVTEPDGEPSAVLLRSVEPVCGVERIRALRFGSAAPMTAYQRKNFLNGPGKVCKGLSLSRADNGTDLLGDQLFLCDSPHDFGCPLYEPPAEHLCVGTRIGVNYAEEARDFPWRFWLEKD